MIFLKISKISKEIQKNQKGQKWGLKNLTIFLLLSLLVLLNIKKFLSAGKFLGSNELGSMYLYGVVVAQGLEHYSTLIQKVKCLAF